MQQGDKIDINSLKKNYPAQYRVFFFLGDLNPNWGLKSILGYQKANCKNSNKTVPFVKHLLDLKFISQEQYNVFINEGVEPLFKRMMLNKARTFYESPNYRLNPIDKKDYHEILNYIGIPDFEPFVEKSLKKMLFVKTDTGYVIEKKYLNAF